MSGCFHFPPDPVAAVGGTGAGLGRRTYAAALNLASKIKVLGVVVGDRGAYRRSSKSLAASASCFSGSMTRFRTSEKLSEIQRSGIVVRQGNQQEFLELSTGQGETSNAPACVDRTRPRLAEGQIKKVLDRREVEQALNDLPKLLSQARAVPVLSNGAMTGFAWTTLPIPASTKRSGCTMEMCSSRSMA